MISKLNTKTVPHPNRPCYHHSDTFIFFARKFWHCKYKHFHDITWWCKLVAFVDKARACKACQLKGFCFSKSWNKRTCISHQLQLHHSWDLFYNSSLFLLLVKFSFLSIFFFFFGCKVYSFSLFQLLCFCDLSSISSSLQLKFYHPRAIA